MDGGSDSGTDPAREEILARLRQASVRGAPADPIPAPSSAAPGPAGGDLDTVVAASAEGDADAAAVALFTERAAGLGIGVHHVANAEDLPRVVASALWGERTRRVVVPRDLSPLWLSELDGVWVMRDDPEAGPLSDRAIAAADAAVSRCAAAVADTATLLFDGRVGQGRRALTLLPDYHLCVVETRQIVADLPAGLALLDPSRPTTWITGPTETSAIDKTVVAGMHGPRRTDVVVVG